MFYFVAEPHPCLTLEESDISLVSLFDTLSKEQMSYRVIATPEQLRMHDFYPAAMITRRKSTSLGKIA